MDQENMVKTEDRYSKAIQANIPAPPPPQSINETMEYYMHMNQI